MIDPFAEIDERTRDWLHLEQTANDRVIHPRSLAAIDGPTNTVNPAYWPDVRPRWGQEVVWLSADRIRRYGPVLDGLAAALDVRLPPDRIPFFLHPQRPRGQARWAADATCSDGLRATPVSSFRSVLVWKPGVPTKLALLKLSLGASIATLPRVVTESEVARAAVISSLFDAIPLSHRAELGLDWFPEPGGIVETNGGTGWLLRQFPRTFGARRDRRLVPAFSLISRHQGELPLLVRMARRSRRRPETFIVDEILRPYVRAMAYLLFEHGLQPEGHTQNVLVEVNGDRALTGRLVLRDLSDTTVNIAYRMARRLPFPMLGERPMRSPWPLSVNAADFADVRSRRVRRGRAVIEGYGQHGFVWPINDVMSRYARRYDSARVTREYLELWQHAARFYTNVTPVIRTRPLGLAADEAVAYYLRETDWDALGAAPAVLPRQAQPLLIDGRACRRAGRVYERVEGAWGDLYLNRGLPEFFYAAY